MRYEDIGDDVEKVIACIYNKEFHSRIYLKEDLFQEARIAVWKYMNKKYGITREELFNKISLEIKHAMMIYINRRYHLRTKGGNAEDIYASVPDTDIIQHDYTLKTLLLLYDVQLIIKKVLKGIWEREKYYRMAVYLLMGYTHEEIAQFLGWHENNVYRRKQLLGKGILRGLENHA